MAITCKIGYEIVAVVENLVTLRSEVCVRLCIEVCGKMYHRFCIWEVPE